MIKDTDKVCMNSEIIINMMDNGCMESNMGEVS